MANWCEGWVKFRGTPEEICNFIKGEFDGSLPKIEKFKKQELWDWVCECPTLGG